MVIPEALDRLVVVHKDNRRIDPASVVDSLTADSVVLIRDTSLEEADSVISSVAQAFGLEAHLRMHTAYAGMYGRKKVGQYFVTVNDRAEYQYVSPHSEGTSVMGVQLASFFCDENTTDGGETILMNVKQASPVWEEVLERCAKARSSVAEWTSGQISQARAMYQVRLPEDTLSEEDIILGELESAIPNLSIVDVLTKPTRIHSRVLERPLYGYWDSLSACDHSAVDGFLKLLIQRGHSLRRPLENERLEELDKEADRRVWRSHMKYEELFECQISIKMKPGDLIIQNNISWTHAVTNWSPASGVRNVAAAFA